MLAASGGRKSTSLRSPAGLAAAGAGAASCFLKNQRRDTREIYIQKEGLETVRHTRVPPFLRRAGASATAAPGIGRLMSKKGSRVIDLYPHASHVTALTCARIGYTVLN